VSLRGMRSLEHFQAPAVARWHVHLHSLATPIHELSGLGLDSVLQPELSRWSYGDAPELPKNIFFLFFTVP
jgi:hypothetical protein